MTTSCPGAHGMHSLAVANDGRIYVAWLDERNIHAPKPSRHAGGHHMESNRELFVADSIDGGKTFSANRKVAENACPCCKTALAVSPDGTVYASWRQVLPGNFRHIAVASSTDGGAKFSAPVIVSDDKWKLQGCPVSGPSLSADANGTLKVVWYAAGESNAPGLYFAETRDQGRTFLAAHAVDAGIRQRNTGTGCRQQPRDRDLARYGRPADRDEDARVGRRGRGRQRGGKCGVAERRAGVKTNCSWLTLQRLVRREAYGSQKLDNDRLLFGAHVCVRHVTGKRLANLLILRHHPPAVRRRPFKPTSTKLSAW